MKEITEKTLIPISFIAVAAGAIFWLTSLYSEVKANAKELAQITAQQVDYVSTVQMIDRRLSRIEGKIGIPTKEE